MPFGGYKLFSKELATCSRENRILNVNDALAQDVSKFPRQNCNSILQSWKYVLNKLQFHHYHYNNC